MSTYLIGYEIKKGSFANSQTGDIIDYNNRLLKCKTNDGNDSNNFGYSGFEIKMKMSEVADSLGVADNDMAVNSALSKFLDKEIEFRYAPKNNVMAVAGFRPVFKK